MSISNIQQEKIMNGRAVKAVGQTNIQAMDVNAFFDVEWSDDDPHRYIGIPNRDFWSEEMSAFLPTPDRNFYFDETALRYALVAFELGRPVMMTGPTGSGKSDFFKQFFARLNWPAIRVQGSDDLDIDYLFGSKGLKDGQTIWEDGILTFARKHDIALCLDEVDSLRQNVQLALNGYLENTGKLNLTGASFSEGVAPSVDSSGHQPIWATSNTGGKSQAGIGWHGTKAINKAVLDRFVHFDVDYLPAHVEQQIILAKCPGIDERIVTPMIQVAEIIRTAYKQGRIETTLSTRSLIDWGNFSTQLGHEAAFQICNYAQSEPSDRQIFKSAYETGIGAALSLPSHLQPEGFVEAA